MAILQGVGMAFFPLCEFLGGQLFKYGGYYVVFGSSLGASVAGILYVMVIPETVTRMELIDVREKNGVAEQDVIPWYKLPYHLFVTGNMQLVESFRYTNWRTKAHIHIYVLFNAGDECIILQSA
jgi:hypothetical protein